MLPLNLLIAEDQLMVRQGLCAMLQREPFIKAIYEAGTGKEALQIVEQHKIDVALLDIKMPEMDGKETAAILKKKYPEIKIVILTGLEGHQLLITLLDIGVHSILQKLLPYTDIVNTIKKVATDGTCYSENILSIIKDHAHRWKETVDQEPDETDKKIIKFISLGETTKQMANTLNLSVRTIEKRRERLMKKVNVQNTAALMAYAFRNGIL